MRTVRFTHAHLGYVADPFHYGISIADAHIDVPTEVEESDGTVWWTLRTAGRSYRFDLEDHLGEQIWHTTLLHLERRRRGERILRRWFDVAGMLVPGVYAEYRHLDDDHDELYLASVAGGVDIVKRIDNLRTGAGGYGGGEFDVETRIDVRGGH